MTGQIAETTHEKIFPVRIIGLELGLFFQGLKLGRGIFAEQKLLGWQYRNGLRGVIVRKDFVILRFIKRVIWLIKKKLQPDKHVLQSIKLRINGITLPEKGLFINRKEFLSLLDNIKNRETVRGKKRLTYIQENDGTLAISEVYPYS